MYRVVERNTNMMFRSTFLLLLLPLVHRYAKQVQIRVDVSLRFIVERCAGTLLIQVDPDPDVSNMKECQGEHQLSCHKANIDLEALDKDFFFEFPGSVTLRKVLKSGWFSQIG